MIFLIITIISITIGVITCIMRWKNEGPEALLHILPSIAIGLFAALVVTIIGYLLVPKTTYPTTVTTYEIIYYHDNCYLQVGDSYIHFLTLNDNNEIVEKRISNTSDSITYKKDNITTPYIEQQDYKWTNFMTKLFAPWDPNSTYTIYLPSQ